MDLCNQTCLSDWRGVRPFYMPKTFVLDTMHKLSIKFVRTCYVCRHH